MPPMWVRELQVMLDPFHDACHPDWSLGTMELPMVHFCIREDRQKRPEKLYIEKRL